MAVKRTRSLTDQRARSLRAPVQKPDAADPSVKKIIRKAAAKPAAKTTTAKKIASKTTSSTTLRRITPKAAAAVADEDDTAAHDAITLAQQRADPVVNHKRSAVERLDDPPPAPLPTLLTRVSRAIERELTQIEIIVGGVRLKPSQRTEAERRARTLASLARTLREVMTLRAGEEKNRQDDELPRDIDELRHQLARRLDQLVAEATAAHPDAAE